MKTKPKTKPKIVAKTPTQTPDLTITENLKQKVFPYIVEDFANALKELDVGESIAFGQLGVFKKGQRSVNGHAGYQYSFKASSLLKK